MGAPKQKWTAEEEAALRAGVIKHGAGKWRTILKDPEFSGVLYSRSNVDLKDKWRNMSVMVHGFGSREKSRPGVKRAHHIPKQDDNVMAIVTVPQSDNDFADVKPLAVSTSPLQIAGTPQSAGPRRSSVRLDNLIIEAISSLKEPGGSNKTTIAAYIEEQYWPPQDFKKILSAKLKYLNSTGKLIKVNRKYRIAPAVTFSDKRRNSVILFPEEKQRISPKSDRIDFKSLSLVEMDLELARMRAQIDVELAKMRTMTPDEAAAFAAQAVQEAEAAVANAEEAAREAEEAEAEAAEAVAFLEAMKKGKTKSKMTI